MQKRELTFIADDFRLAMRNQTFTPDEAQFLLKYATEGINSRVRAETWNVTFKGGPANGETRALHAGSRNYRVACGPTPSVLDYSKTATETLVDLHYVEYIIDRQTGPNDYVFKVGHDSRDTTIRSLRKQLEDVREAAGCK